MSLFARNLVFCVERNRLTATAVYRQGQKCIGWLEVTPTLNSDYMVFVVWSLGGWRKSPIGGSQGWPCVGSDLRAGGSYSETISSFSTHENGWGIVREILAEGTHAKANLLKCADLLLHFMRLDGDAVRPIMGPWRRARQFGIIKAQIASEPIRSKNPSTMVLMTVWLPHTGKHRRKRDRGIGWCGLLPTSCFRCFPSTVQVPISDCFDEIIDS